METNPELVLMDYDLGDPNQNGFDAVKSLRANGFENKICMHSNRGTFEFQEKIAESGDDLMLPNPMSKTQFISLLFSIAKSHG